jgi:hypothetical protein
MVKGGYTQMKISNLLFGANIKIPERHEDGTYKLADYTLGIFGAGVAVFIRKDIHSLCRFGGNTEYAGAEYYALCGLVQATI